jgi:hypothetical protein
MGQADGAPTTASWLKGRCRITALEAGARVKTARMLRELPLVARAFEAGEISFEHARAVALLAHETDVADTRKVQRQILDVARLTDPTRFCAELHAIRDSLRRRRNEDEGNRKDERDSLDRRELAVTPVLDGFSIRGWLPDEAGSLVKTVLDSLSAPVAGESRTAAQRNADALIELCRRSADDGDLSVNHGVRPHMLVVTELDALLDAERAAMARLAYDGQASPTAVQRIACDAAITRVLIRPDGQILDLGRTTRTVSPAQWKALVIRDGGCAAPGCDRPAQWCEAHHLHPWILNGPTDLDNLVLLCGYHHRLLHEGGWALRICRQRWVLVRPDGSMIAGEPVGYQPSRARHIADAILNGPRGPCLE